MGNSSVWPCKTSACQRRYRTRAVGTSGTCMGLRTICWTRADVVKEATPQKHTYVCTEERTVVCRPVLTPTEVRAPQTSAR